MGTDENAVAVQSGNVPAPTEQSRGEIVEHHGNIVSEDAFCMTIEQAQAKIKKELDMYALVQDVAAKLLNDTDKYYMSQLSAKDWKKPKDGELPVLKKKAVDKLLGFFKIGIFPEVEKIDGGYQVTVIGRDRNGGYIGTGKGICTCYEKKYAWIKADDHEYAVTNEANRRSVERKSQYGNYKVKQIRTDERAIAHTLTSMAEKRARAAFVRKLMPDLDKVCFEGEAFESDHQYADNHEEPSSGDSIMSQAEIGEFYRRLNKAEGYDADMINTAIQKALKRDTFGSLTIDEAEKVEKKLKALKKKGGKEHNASNADDQGGFSL